MNYVIEYNGCYVRVLKCRYMTSTDEMDKIFKVEHGLNLREKPDIYSDETLARKIIKLIQEQEDTIVFANLNILGNIEDGDYLDVTKLRVKKIYLLDADKDDEKQMRKMFSSILDEDLENLTLESLDTYKKDFSEYEDINDDPYYRGMKDMLEMIVTNGYEKILFIGNDNKHYIGRFFE